MFSIQSVWLPCPQLYLVFSRDSVLPSPEVKPPDFFLAQLPYTIKWSRASRDIPLPQTANP